MIPRARPASSSAQDTLANPRENVSITSSISILDVARLNSGIKHWLHSQAPFAIASRSSFDVSSSMDGRRRSPFVQLVEQLVNTFIRTNERSLAHVPKCATRPQQARRCILARRPNTPSNPLRSVVVCTPDAELRWNNDFVCDSAVLVFSRRPFVASANAINPCASSHRLKFPLVGF